MLGDVRGAVGGALDDDNIAQEHLLQRKLLLWLLPSHFLLFSSLLFSFSSFSYFLL